MAASEDATLKLILRLQIEDLDAIARTEKGNAREGHVTDNNLALQQYRDELYAQLSLLSDRQMAQSISQAPTSDAAILRNNEVLEALGISRRDIARRIARLNNETRAESGAPQAMRAESTITSVNNKNNNNSIDYDFDEHIAKLRLLRASYMANVQNVQSDDQKPLVYSNEVEEAAGPSSDHPIRPSHDETGRCVSCHEDKVFFDVVRVPCGHEYCRDCLKELFQAIQFLQRGFPVAA